MPLVPFGLRGDGGEVRPFTAVNADTMGSPDRSLSMKPTLLMVWVWITDGITVGAATTGALSGRRPGLNAAGPRSIWIVVDGVAVESSGPSRAVIRGSDGGSPLGVAQCEDRGGFGASGWGGKRAVDTGGVRAGATEGR